MSFSKGKKSETSIKHNNRSIEKDFDFNKKGHQHIKRLYTPLNEVLVHKNIKDVYEQEFGQAVKDYNAKQKRKDRKIEDYYSKVKHSKNQRTQYEFLVQVGNKENYTDENRITSRQWQTSKEILEKYFEGFQKRNPNLVVYNAALHMDEEGAPHLHLNVVPVAHLPNAKRGLKVKPSLNKALEEEGFPVSKQDNRKQFKDFQHREANALAEVAKEFGIERADGQKNRLKDVHEYKQAMRRIEEMERTTEQYIENQSPLDLEEAVQTRTKKLQKENEDLKKKVAEQSQELSAYQKFVKSLIQGIKSRETKLGEKYHDLLRGIGVRLFRNKAPKLFGFDLKDKNILMQGYIKEKNLQKSNTVDRQK